MATRSAPTVDGSPTFSRVTFALIDSRGDKRSVSHRIPADATEVQIEAVADALATATNASVYSISVQAVYSSLPQASNATDSAMESVFDNVALNLKDVAADSQQTAYIPAPLGTLILDGDIVDTGNAQYVAWRDAVDTMLGGAYAPVSVRFTERREKNDSTPAT